MFANLSAEESAVDIVYRRNMTGIGDYCLGDTLILSISETGDIP